MLVGVFAPEVPDDVAVVEVESDFQHPEPYASLTKRVGNVGGVIPVQPEVAERSGSHARSQDGIAVP